MIRLDNTNRSLQAVLAGTIATNQLNVTTSYADATTASFAGATTAINTNNTTAVTIAAAPALSVVRTIDSVTVFNADTVSATVTIRYNDNGTIYPIVRTTLLTGETLFYTHGSGWMALDVNGNLKQVTSSLFASLIVTGQLTAAAIASSYVVNASATYAVLTTDYSIRQTTAASVYTLPAPASFNNRLLRISTEFAGTVISASSNVVPLAGGAASTAILPATAGKWADLQSNGSNWVITASN
jgi:hypothetical protein